MKPIVIIPARGGSKRIPRKNLVDIGGVPALGILISNLDKMGFFDRVIVSSDDKEIVEVAAKFGAESSIRSLSRLSDDHAPFEDAVRDCILVNNLENTKDPIFCIYPLALLLNGTNITDALSILSNFPDYFVISAGEMDINPLRHTFKSGSRGIEVLFPENNHLRSQDLPSIYFDVGMFYLAYPKTWIQPEKFWYQNNAKFVKIPRENCIDVDSYRDLEKLISRINIIGSGDAKS